MQILIRRQGEQIGAWTEKEIRHYYREGRLISSDTYWHEGMPQWESVASLCAVPPPPPPNVHPILPAPAPRSVSGWRGNLYTAVPLILAVLLAVAVGPTHAQNNNPSFVIGGYVGMVFLAFAVAIPISLFFRGARRPVVQCLVICVVFGVLFIVRQRVEASWNVLAEMNRFSEKEREDSARQVATNHYIQPNSQRTEAEIAKLRAMSQGESGRPKKLTDAALQIMQDMSQRVSACRQVESKMLSLGLSPDKLTSLDAIERRNEAVAACQPPIHDLLTFLQNMDETARDFLSSEGVSSSDIDSFVAGMHHSGRREALQSYWQLESTILDDLTAKLDLLKTSWGKWHVENQAVVFDQPSMVVAYDENAAKFKDDVAKQKLAQQAALAPTPK